MSNTLDQEGAVRQRYAVAAQQLEPELCCPVDYHLQYLQIIPQEVIDRDQLDAFLKDNPVTDEAGLQRLELFTAQLRRESPMVADDSIDVVVSNCVLNLVDAVDKEQLFLELFRVLRPGGRAVISDIVSDEPVPGHLQQDSELWSGCISGAFQESDFLAAFEHAGFYGVEMPVWQQQPWRTVEGIEFRSVTVIAYKGKEGPCFEHNQAVIYRGPFSRVHDDNGHVFERGQRTAVCGKTFDIMMRPPYGDQFIAVEPREAIDPEHAQPFECTGGAAKRPPSVTKGSDFRLTSTPVSADGCESGDCC